MREGRSKIFEERGLEGGIMGRGGSWSTRTEVEEEDVAGGGRYTKRKVVTHDFRRLLRTGYSDSLRSHSGSGYSQSNVTIEVTLARIGRRGQMTSRKSNDEEAKRIKDFQVASPGATRQVCATYGSAFSRVTRLALKIGRCFAFQRCFVFWV
jgi:hypothetical protein